MKTCTTCHANLPLRFFYEFNGKRFSACRPCISSDTRLRKPLPEIPRDAVQVRLNNAAALWFYPAQRTNLLRYAP